MKRNLLYEAPECELLQFRLENSILSTWPETKGEDADPEDVDMW